MAGNAPTVEGWPIDHAIERALAGWTLRDPWRLATLHELGFEVADLADLQA